MPRPALLPTAYCPLPTVCRPPLVIYGGEASPPSPSGPLALNCDMTLSEFFLHWFVPRYLQSPSHHRTAATRAEFCTSLGIWVELTGDPPLRLITSDVCAALTEQLVLRKGRRGGGLRKRTCDKHQDNLDLVLRGAGPRTRDCKWAATEHGLLSAAEDPPRAAPWFVPVELDEEAWDKDVLAVAEIRAWLEACRSARQPVLMDCTASEWWRALILFLYNSGLRIGATLQLRRGMLRRTDGLVWIDVPGRISKQGKGRVLNLSSHAQAALALIPTEDLIFPWPHTLKHLHELRRAMQAAAGIAPQRRFGFHSLRGSNATELFAIDPRAAQENLGHEKLSTTIDSYVEKSAQVKAQAARTGPALERIPQPHRKGGPAANQLTFFT